MTTNAVETEFGSYPDYHLDPNPCEAWVFPTVGEPHTCGVIVPFTTPLLFGQVMCDAHTETAPDDFIPYCDYCGGEGHADGAHDIDAMIADFPF